MYLASYCVNNLASDTILLRDASSSSEELPLFDAKESLVIQLFTMERVSIGGLVDDLEGVSMNGLVSLLHEACLKKKKPFLFGQFDFLIKYLGCMQPSPPQPFGLFGCFPRIAHNRILLGMRIVISGAEHPVKHFFII